MQNKTNLIFTIKNYNQSVGLIAFKNDLTKILIGQTQHTFLIFI